MNSRFGFVLQEAYLQFKRRLNRGALNNDIENFIVSHFHPTGNSSWWGKYETCSIFTLGASHIYDKLWSKNETSVKPVFLISTSHWPKPLSVPETLPETDANNQWWELQLLRWRNKRKICQYRLFSTSLYTIVSDRKK